MDTLQFIGIMIVTVSIILSGCLGLIDPKPQVTPTTLPAPPPTTPIVITSTATANQTPISTVKTVYDYNITISSLNSSIPGNLTVFIEYHNSSVSGNIILFCNKSKYIGEVTTNTKGYNLAIYETNCLPSTKGNITFDNRTIKIVLPTSGNRWVFNLTEH